MRWLKIVGALFCLVAPVRGATEAPEWTQRGRPSDATYKYYVGRSSGSESEQTGFNEATREAYEQAIRENFGFQTRIQSDAYESSTSVLSTKRVQVLSQDIRVFGFEQVDFFLRKAGSAFDVWILYRYPIVEIAREKSRLLGAKEKTTEFSEQGSLGAGKKSGILEVKTNPPGAALFVDGESYGVTPMRLLGVLSPGKHTLRIDHPTHSAAEEALIITPGQTTKIDKTLVPALARLSLTTEPSHANVVINGQQLGTTPLAGIEVPANKTLKLEVSHAESNPFSVELEVAKDEFNAKHFDLPLKNASLLVRSTPPGAQVWIDGSSAGSTPTGPKNLSAGKHRVQVAKLGFREERLELILRGGEKRNETVILETSKVGSEPAIWRQYSQNTERVKAPEEAALFFSFWLPQFQSSTVDYPYIAYPSWGASLTLAFGKWWGVELGYLYGARSVQYSDAKVSLSAHHFKLGVPVFLWRGAQQHLYASADLDYALQRYTLIYTAGGLAQIAPGKNQLGYGISLGYRWWWGSAPAFGVGLRVGAMKYGNTSSLTGLISYSGGFECTSVF